MPLVVRPKIIKDIIGTDMMFPVTYDQNGDLRLTGSADENLRQAIFITIFTYLKERFLHRDFGTEVSRSLFKQASSRLANRLKKQIEDSLNKHEFRISDVAVNAGVHITQDNRIDIEVNFTDIKYRHEHNLIYPFKLDTGEIL